MIRRPRTKTAGRIARVAMLGALALALALSGSAIHGRSASTAEAAVVIENTYKANGPWATTTGTATISGQPYTLHYPSNLGANNFDHPILSWGNGTGANPSQYADTLQHLASWGFVVIAGNSGTQGLGTQILAGAQYLVAQNGVSSSIFYQKLNTAQVGAFGHSQGAGGTLNATLNSGGLIKTAVTIALPDPIWWSTPVPNLSGMTASIFFVRGSNDFLATANAATNWYNQVPGAAAKASRKSTGHNEIQAVNNRLQGYVTAWMMYRLQGDNTARGAFAGATPEVPTNTNWQHWAGKNLP
jgi:hypothetical protein